MTKDTVVIYGFSILASLSVSLINYLAIPTLSTNAIFITGLPIVALTTGVGGVIAGLISVLLINATTLILIKPELTLDSLLFGFSALIIILVVEKSKENLMAKIIKRQNKQYEKQIGELELTYKKAQEDIKARDEFLSMASHELKTPLTAMLLQIQAALSNIKNVSLVKFSPASLLKRLENVEGQTERLSKMINDLLNVSLITTGRFNLEIEEVDLAKTVRDVIARFEDTLKKENIKLHIKVNDPVKGKWDKIRIEQIINNLLTNAIKYGDSQPIEIKVTKNGQTARLEVKDSGIGIPDNLQKLVFSKFARGVKSKEYKGLGLGLYITKQIVAAHGGQISVKSEPQQGSNFIVELPIS